MSKAQPGTVIVRDVTENYRYAPLTGSLAIAAQRGEKIDVYIITHNIQIIKTEYGQEP